MKQITYISIVFAALFISVPAQATSCAEIATQAADKLNAEVIGAQATEEGCKVKLRLPATDGKQSRIVTRTLNN